MPLPAHNEPDIHPVPTDSPGLRRRSYYAMPEDDQAVEMIRKKFGLSTDSDAVRLALRVVAGDSVKFTMVPQQVRKLRVRFTVPVRS